MKKSVVQARLMRLINFKVGEYRRKHEAARNELQALYDERSAELREYAGSIVVLLGELSGTGIELPTLDEPAEAPTTRRKKVVRRKKTVGRKKRAVPRKKKRASRTKVVGRKKRTTRKKVAKKAAAVTKSQAIRNYQTAHPNATPKVVVAALKLDGIDVTPAHVSTTKSQMRARKGKKKPAARKK